MLSKTNCSIPLDRKSELRLAFFLAKIELNRLVLLHLKGIAMKYVVIFKAKIQHLDPEYFKTAQILRDKALSQFNCEKFETVAENAFEIALSYWNSLQDIQAWHQDADHQVAQRIGKDKWYQSFSVEVCEIKTSYPSLIEEKLKAVKPD